VYKLPNNTATLVSIRFEKVPIKTTAPNSVLPNVRAGIAERKLKSRAHTAWFY